MAEMPTTARRILAELLLPLLKKLINSASATGLAGKAEQFLESQKRMNAAKSVSYARIVAGV